MNPARSLEAILKDQPKFHRLVDIHPQLDATLTSWAARLQTLQFIESLLQRDMRTLETGCGHSTVMFALAGVKHFCITPARAETERVEEFCRVASVDTSNVRFLIGNSQDELPKLQSDLMFDLAFIDGGHFFPIPCIDWYYADIHLARGGILVIDDLRIPSVQILYNFLHVDRNWQQIAIIEDTVFFRKLRRSENMYDWIEQEYNRSFPDWTFLSFAERCKRKAPLVVQQIRSRLRRGMIADQGNV